MGELPQSDVGQQQKPASGDKEGDDSNAKRRKDREHERQKKQRRQKARSRAEERRVGGRVEDVEKELDSYEPADLIG